MTRDIGLQKKPAALPRIIHFASGDPRSRVAFNPGHKSLAISASKEAYIGFADTAVMDLEKMSSNSKGLIDTLTQLSGRRGEPPADPPPPRRTHIRDRKSPGALFIHARQRRAVARFKAARAVQSSTRKDVRPPRAALANRSPWRVCIG